MDESEKAPRIEVQNIDHLGIVADSVSGVFSLPEVFDLALE
jgi:hypothetical protein